MIVHATLDNGQVAHARVHNARLYPAMLARGIQPLGPALARPEPFLVVETTAA